MLTAGQLPRVVGGANYLLGNDPSYSAGVDRYVKADEAAAKRSPWSYGTGAVAGGIFGGAGLAQAGNSSVPRLGSLFGNLTDAAALGGVEAAGNTYTGNPEDYAVNAGKGALAAAPFGFLGMAAGPAGEGAYRGVATTRGIPARLAEAGATDAAGLQEIISGARGPRAMLPDAGPAMQGTAQGAVLDPLQPGPATLLNNLRRRNDTSAPYIDRSLNYIFGPAPVPSEVEAGVRGRMGALSPAYEHVLNNARAVDSAPLAQHLEAQIVNERGPAQAALRQVRDMLDIPGNPGNLDPHPRALQATREAVRGMRDDPNIDHNTRRVLTNAEQWLTQEMHSKVPGIRQLDSQYAELGAQERAVQTDSPGSRIFDTSREGVIRPSELADTLNESSLPKGVNVGPSAEPMRLRQAARAELDRIVGTKKNDLLALENVLANPQDYNSQKLATMFGQDRADQIAGVLRNERIGRETDTAVRLGSQTATRTASMKAQDAQSGKLPLETTLTGLFARGAGWAKDALFREQAAAQRNRIAQFMAPANPVEVQAAARQLLAVQPDRTVRANLARTLMQGGGRGAGAGFIPKDYRTE